MSTSPSVPPVLSVRDRRHAEAVREIKEAALRHHAAGELSLRAVARDLGMSAQALYHYFPSRDELITALITDGQAAAAQAVAAGREAGGDRRGRLVGAAVAYRDWAVDQPHVFRLVYGDPIPGYAAPEGGPTVAGALRLGVEF
ncbi:TetR/AcrR family transcriptional regulator, partial [Pseudonocardia pini]|uniref:TetR/AcrR family transcriptional regulator n=1 Tax=Pseudonocardia pini TaxID=2758030 RepID=UPI0015F07FE5